MKALILAGGEASRLGDLAKAMPKPMMPLCGRPVLERQIDLLKRYGITDITLITGRLGNIIEEYFGSGEKFGVKLSYHQESAPLGTMGVLKEMEALLPDEFLVLYSDVMLDMDFGRLLNFHKEKKADCTLVLHPNDHPHDSDLVELDSDRRAVAVHPKPHDENTFYRNQANAGIYIGSKKILAFAESGKKADFARHILPDIVGKMRVYGYVTPEYLKDIGTPERLAAVSKDFESGRVRNCNLDHPRPTVFLDRDGVINKECGLVYKPEQFELNPRAGQAIRLLNKAGWLALVISNQPVIARNLCDFAGLELITKKMDTLLGAEGAFLDGVYYCPHHPDKGYPEENPAYKIDCACRKPKTGMVEQAAKDFNPAMAASYFVGDADADVLCGRRAGLKTIGIKSHRLIKEKPDFECADLFEAVQLILGRNA